MTGVERVRIDTERNFLDVLDKVDQLTTEAVDPTHVFTLSQVYEGLLLKMGEKGNDGGQFLRPVRSSRLWSRLSPPSQMTLSTTLVAGPGGFLPRATNITGKLGNDATVDQLEMIKQRAFLGQGKRKPYLSYRSCESHSSWYRQAESLAWQHAYRKEIYGGLFEDAPQAFDVILTNPPFGGKESKEAQTNFDYKTGATQALFLQHVIRSLREGGRCGIVLDEGLLFRTNEDAFVKTKRKLLDDCNLWCVVSLPGGVFTAAGAGVKTNLLFFTKGQPTQKIWYYDLSELKIRKKIPLISSILMSFCGYYLRRAR